MIAGDHHDWPAGAAQFLNGEIDHLTTRPIRIEEISCDQQQVDILLNGEIDDGAERLVIDVTTAWRVRIGDVSIKVKMHIRRV